MLKLKYFKVGFLSFGQKFRKISTSRIKLKKFDEIPGPRGPWGIGNLYNYLPYIGKYSWLELHKAGMDKYQRYGSIVKETMMPGMHILWLYEPDDIATVLNEKDYPQRRSHLALQKYRIDRPHIYRTAGLLPTNGEEWWRLRSELQKELSAPKQVRSFLFDVDYITKQFVDLIDTETTIDMLPELARLNLELTCLLAFDERMDAFSEYERSPNSRTSRLIKSAAITNSCILPTDQGLQLWKYFETPTYKKLKKAQNYMESVAVDLVSQKISYYREENDSTQPGNMCRSSLLDEYLKNPNLDLCDIVGMAADLLLAGIDTTSYTSSFVLYHIAKNTDVQTKLFAESRSILKSLDDPITEVDLSTRIPYTRAVLKEVFRLNPVSIGVGRILNNDSILSGYEVPKGTIVVTQNLVASRLEKNFYEAEKFMPERWLNRKESPNPYVVLPFGHGMRSCIARRMAEQNILVFILRIIRNYELQWLGCHSMDIQTLLINKPDQKVLINFKRRNDEH